MSAGTVQRTDKIMADDDMRQMLATAAVGRTATVDEAGAPYVVPNLFVYRDDEIWLHTAKVNGHFQRNATGTNTQVCFEVDEAGAVYPYGGDECSTSISYRSIVCFGTIRIVDDPAQKAAFFDSFMDKYGGYIGGRPLSFYPRLAATTVYAISIRQMSGKAGALPDIGAQWPASSIGKPPSRIQPPDGTPLRKEPNPQPLP